MTMNAIDSTSLRCFFFFLGQKIGTRQTLGHRYKLDLNLNGYWVTYGEENTKFNPHTHARYTDEHCLGGEILYHYDFL